MSTTVTMPLPSASRATIPRGHDHDRSTHTVQFYTQDEPFLVAISQLIGTTLGAGGAAIVIATGSHRDGLLERLKARGLDMDSAVGRGRYVALDAAETLARFVPDGMPDASRFREVMGGVINRAKAAAEREDSRLVIFGEMVALLWKDGKMEDAILLEQLWNDLARTHSFSLHCGYPMTAFHRKEDGEPFLRICAQHSAVIPSESYTALTSEEERRRTIAHLQQQAEAFGKLAIANEELRRSEERFRLLVQEVKDHAIFMLDPNGHILSWNLGAERIKGYRRDEIIGRHFSVFYPAEDLQAGKPARELEIAIAEGRLEDEGWRLRKDGSRFWANVVITAIRDGEHKLRGFAKVTRDMTERKRAEEAVRDLSARLLKSQDEERRRVARELHDSTAQTLSALTLNLALLQGRGVGKDDQKTLEALAEAQALAEQAGREIRNLSHLLHPPDLDAVGLTAAIRWYAQRFSQRTEIGIDLDLPSNLVRLPSDLETALFRVVQESLNNVHRHSGSSAAKVRIAVKGAYIILEIEDKGCGMPSDLLSSTTKVDRVGIGIAGMRERMRQLGGRLELSSTSQGATVRVTVPLSGSGTKDQAFARAEA